MKTKRRFESVERQEIADKSRQCLWSKEGKVGMDYLLSQRCLSEKIIKDFKLGYLPSHLHSMDFPVRRSGFAQLAGRIIIPVFDASNNLIVLSSRLIDETLGFLPKHWHESYEKSFYLFGVNNAKQSMREQDCAIVVEGQFDVMQMHNHGFTNTSGLCSTNFSEVQFALLSRYSEYTILLLDKDENKSGQKGTEKAMEKFSHQSKFGAISFAEYTDPDEYLKKYGNKKLKDAIQKKLQQLKDAT